MSFTVRRPDPAVRRVVVTGLGIVSPLAAGRETSWKRLHNGGRAVRWLSHVGCAGAPASVPPLASETDNAPRPDRVIRLALAAATEAIRDAGLSRSPSDAERLAHAGCVVGTSKGGFEAYLELAAARREGRDATVPDWTSAWPNGPAVAVASRWSVGGPVLCPVAACATGLACLIRGADLIRSGTCDLVLAGSSDASLQPILLASYRRMGVLAPATPETAPHACRPFDRTRAGFAAGEGAAVLVLEELTAAQARGATIYAEWLGDALAADPTHVTSLATDPTSLTWALRSALSRSRLRPEEIDLVNYHGTATRQNDACEAAAVQAAFGEAASKLQGFSLKGALGHLLGAAGSVETAFTLLALRDGIVPPTMNLTEPDPAFALDFTPNESRRCQASTALKLSLGFGGHLAAAVVRRWS